MKIIVSQHGQFISETILESGREYFAGRSRQCDINLPQSEISRKHLRFYQREGHWKCELISGYGTLFLNDNPVKDVSLVEGAVLRVSDIEIRCEAGAQLDKTEVVNPSSATHTESAIPTEILPSDKTNTGIVNLKSVLLRLDVGGEPIEEFALSDGFIEAGRNAECEIILRDIKASRKHFTIEKTYGGYQVKDLESTHGVHINGNKISEAVLRPGDILSVGEEKFLFQEVHPAFEHLPAVIPEPNVISYDEQYSAVVKMQPPRTTTNVIRISLVAIIAASLFYYVTDDKKSQAPNKRQPTSVETLSDNGLSKLTNEQKKYLEDTYNLSVSLYTSGKYDLAALEISKIFQIIPNYKDSRNIEALCQQALEIKKQKEETDRLKREQDELGEKVASILAECENILKAKKYNDVAACVDRVSEMDPENAKAKFLIASAQAKLEEMQNSAEAKREAAQRVAKAKSMFEKGQKLFKEKRYPAAVSTFSTITKLSFSDKDGIKQRAVAAINLSKQKMNDEAQVFVREGKTALEAKDFKTAIAKLNKALEMSPTSQSALDLKEKAASELRQEMKNLYGESVIEENLGNIESAKKKWRTIIDQNLKTDSYYEKAKNKLGKYEK